MVQISEIIEVTTLEEESDIFNMRTFGKNPKPKMALKISVKSGSTYFIEFESEDFMRVVLETLIEIRRNGTNGKKYCIDMGANRIDVSSVEVIDGYHLYLNNNG